MEFLKMGVYNYEKKNKNSKMKLIFASLFLLSILNTDIFCEVWNSKSWRIFPWSLTFIDKSIAHVNLLNSPTTCNPCRYIAIFIKILNVHLHEKS